MTRKRKYQRALADTQKLLSDPKDAQEFAAPLYQLERSMAQLRKDSMVFDAAMKEAELEWNRINSSPVGQVV